MAAHLQSAPRSQTSSFEESIPSQGSYQHPSSSGNVQREPTPTTSLSNPSSQEQMIEGANQSPLAHGQRKTSNTPQAPIAPMIQTASEGGTKRTADGQVKERSPTSPIVGRYGHSRTSSTTSRGSEIGELSSQLKTRLSYALYKVQNGLESHSLPELETLTSTNPSPLTSPASTLRSPRSRPTSSSTIPDRPMFPPSPAQHHLRIGTSGHDYAYQNGTAPPLNSARPRDYDAFWREHSGNSTNTHPSLAPPADIMPRNARQPSRLQTSTHNSSVAHPYAPSTPPPYSNTRSKPRTPSQNAEMEKDAVETLVFMSSPQNTGYINAREKMSRTPLRQSARLVDGRGRDVDRLAEESSGEGSSSEEGG